MPGSEQPNSPGHGQDQTGSFAVFSGIVRAGIIGAIFPFFHALGCIMDIVTQLFDTSGFKARWRCGEWSPLHGWVHIVADLAIFGAYLAIPCVLVYFVLRRRDVPFIPIFWLFG